MKDTTVKKKFKLEWSYLLGITFIIVVGFLFISAYNVQRYIIHYQWLLDNAISIPPSVYNSILNEIQRLSGIFLVYVSAGIVLLCVAVWLIVRTKIKLRDFVFLFILLAGMLIIPVKSESGSQRWYAWVDIPKTVNISGSTITFYGAKADILVQSNMLSYGFVAFYLALGNPSSIEWIQIGYYQNVSGYHLYADSYVKGVYSKIIFGEALLGTVYHFMVNSIDSSAYVYFGGSLIHSVVLSDAGSLYYISAGESTDIGNTLFGYFTNLRLILDNLMGPASLPSPPIEKEWLSEYVSTKEDFPYSVELIYGGTDVTGMKTSGGFSTSSAGPNKIRCGGGGGPAPKLL